MRVFARTLIFGWIAFVVAIALLFTLPKATSHFFSSLFFPLSMLGLLIATVVYKIVDAYKTGMTRTGP